MQAVDQSWTQITDVAVSTLTIQHIEGGSILLAATDGTAPGADADVFQIHPHENYLGIGVAEVWPGKTTGTVWAKTEGSLGARVNIIGG